MKKLTFECPGLNCSGRSAGLGSYGLGECIPRVGLMNQVDVVSEGERFSDMSCWNEYLTGKYGNYVRQPLEDTRKSPALAVWKTKQAESESEA